MSEIAEALRWELDHRPMRADQGAVALWGIDHLPVGLTGSLDVFTDWKPDADRLVACGVSEIYASSQLGTERYGTLIVRPEREHIARRVQLARALLALEPGGELLCVAPVREGGKRIAAELEELGAVNVDANAKARCRLVRAMRPAAIEVETLRSWAEQGEPRRLSSGLWSQPGLFSWDHADLGSELLASVLPARLGARVIDAGAGWGWLSDAIVAKPGRCETLALLEADRRALDLAVRNVGDRATCRPFWWDATGPWPIEGADAIVCNPPFHDVGRADRRVGEAMLAQALISLAPGGVLWAVANQHLPYEDTLARLGAHVRVVARGKGFKAMKITRDARRSSATQGR